MARASRPEPCASQRLPEGLLLQLPSWEATGRSSLARSIATRETVQPRGTPSCWRRWQTS
eukprot:10842863-Alexandrium_andersonii.AAC.1